MIWSIPLPDENSPSITQSVALGGRSYVMKLRYNSREDRWSLSLSTEDGDAILSGATLVVGIDLLRTIPSSLSYVPPGRMFMAGSDDPTLTTMNTVALFYEE